MAVAWVGNRVASFDSALAAITALLSSCRNPVISVSADVDGVRAALALARRIGAVVDHGGGTAVDAEIELFTATGGLFTSPGEARRRADLLVAVGTIPPAHRSFMAELAAAPPDLAQRPQRALFAIGTGKVAKQAFGERQTAVAVGAPGLPLTETLGALRALLAGRPLGVRLAGADRLAAALRTAAYPVFLCAGQADEPLALPVVQGLLSDLASTTRACALMLTASEEAWTAVQVAGWTAGTPLPLGFDGEEALHEPSTFDAETLVASGAADLHLCIGIRPAAVGRQTKTVVLAPGVTGAVRGAAVTLACGRAGVDHDGAGFSSRLGTFAALRAAAPVDAPSVAATILALTERLPERVAA